MMRGLAYYIPNLKACLSIFRIKIAEGFQYRMAGLAGASTSIFWGLIEIVVLTVFYKYSSNSNGGFEAGMSLKQVVSYVWIAQLLFLMQPMNIDNDILGKINTGDVAIEMCRPLDLYSHWFAKLAATRLTPMFWRGSVIVLVGLLLPASYGLSAPSSMSGFLFMLLSIFCAFLLCTAYAMFATVVRMNITVGEGPTYVIMLLGGILSGAYLPLQLWPVAMQRFLFYQPFAGYLDIPARLYIGTLAPEKAVFAMLLQLFWVVIFVIAGRLMMARRLKNIVVQGG